VGKKENGGGRNKEEIRAVEEAMRLEVKKG
jgi:hypothetical protein